MESEVRRHSASTDYKRGISTGPTLQISTTTAVVGYSRCVQRHVLRRGYPKYLRPDTDDQHERLEESAFLGLFATRLSE